jgi:transcriptional regulator with XRE-family HTH domain
MWRTFAIGAARAAISAEPSRAEPSRAEPSRADARVTRERLPKEFQMPGRRRRVLEVAAERKVGELKRRIGGEVVAMRRRRNWTQDRLAERAGVDRLVVSRVERGVVALDVELLQRLAIAFEVPLNVAFGRDPREDVADAGHLAMQELVLRLGRRGGYEGRFELATRPAEPWRLIDVVLAAEQRHRMICVECWNTIGDVGAAVRTSMRKVAELDAMAAGRLGGAASAGLVWVVRATARNRNLVDRYPEVFAARFVGSSKRWVAALTEGTDPPAEPGLVWTDVAATRLFAWRRAATGT